MRSLHAAAVACLVLAALLAGSALVGPTTADDPATSALASEPTGPETPTGDGVTVAVLDTGIDDGHDALAGRVVDRVDLTDDQGTALDSNGHGTHVAGVLAETAPGVDLVDVRVLSEEGEGDAERIAAGIEYAVQEAGADVILLSLDVRDVDPVPIDDRVEWATDQGVVAVASAGNTGADGPITTPGTTPELLTVGATDADGSVLSHSARGPTDAGTLKPELLAPGEDIAGPEAGTADGTVTRTGTSFAGPQVAGTVATLLEREPTLSPAAIQDRLVSTARPLPEADPFAAGSGHLDGERALEPDVTVQGAPIDFGLVADEDPIDRQITLENHREEPITIDLEAYFGPIDDPRAASDAITLNRSTVPIPADGTADLAITVDPSETGETSWGALEYAVDGEQRAIPIGMVRGSEVTVEKRPLTEGDRVDGNPFFFFSEDGTHSGIQDFGDGETTFVAGEGEYALWSKGVDSESGSIVFLSERRAFEGDERVVFDERETVPVGVDAQPLVEEYGPLANHTIAVSMSAEAGEQRMDLSRTVLDADNRTVRISEDPENSIAITYLLADATGDDRLDAANVFALHYEESVARWTSPVVVQPDALETTTYRFHRTTQDLGFELRDTATTRFTWNDPARYWFDAGDRHVQHVHRSPGATHDRLARGDGWRATLDGQAEGTVDVLAHPKLALVEELSVQNETLSVRGDTMADGAGTAFDPGGTHNLMVETAGETSANATSEDPRVSLSEAQIDPDQPVDIRLEGQHPDGRLSTETLTELRLGSGEEPAIPLVTNLAVDADATNAAGPGSVNVTVETEGVRVLAQPRVWYATDGGEEPPWADATGWERAETGYSDRDLTATLEVPDDAETVSLAAAFEGDGDRVRTMTRDAFYAGEAPNTSTRDISGVLEAPDGTPADNDSVVVRPLDDSGPVELAQTDPDGSYSVEVPKDDTYAIEYRHGDPWILNATPGDDRPAFAALGAVTVTDADVTVNRTLPRAHRLDVRVEDDRGQPVPNATVEVVHHDGDTSLSATGSPDEEGRLAFGDEPGIDLADNVTISVTPPDDTTYVQTATQHRIDDAQSATVVLETNPPDATLEENRNWMLEGTPVTLDASESDVPADASAYRWDLSGNGSIDEVTAEPWIRHAPPVGVTDLSVTVVDEAGRTASASTTVQVDPIGD